MKYYLFVTVFLASLCLVSCGSKETKAPATQSEAISNEQNRVYTPDVEYVKTNGEYIISLNGSPYTGNVWAEDETCYQTFKNGRIVGGVIYHANGNKAVEVLSMSDEDKHYFDESGKEIRDDMFFDQYDEVLSSTNGKLPIQ